HGLRGRGPRFHEASQLRRCARADRRLPQRGAAGLTGAARASRPTVRRTPAAAGRGVLVLTHLAVPRVLQLADCPSITRRRASTVTTLRSIGLCLILLAGAAGLIASSIADFNAQTTNASTFSSGTLVLSDAKTSGTTCLSTGGGTTDTNTNASGCDDLIAATVQKPGGTASSAVVTLREVGSIATGTFHVFASSACASTNAG